MSSLPEDDWESMSQGRQILKVDRRVTRCEVVWSWRKREDDLIAVSPTGPCCANKAQQRLKVGKFIGPSIICPRITSTVGKSCNWSIFHSQDGGGVGGRGDANCRHDG